MEIRVWRWEVVLVLEDERVAEVIFVRFLVGLEVWWYMVFDISMFIEVRKLLLLY